MIDYTFSDESRIRPETRRFKIQRQAGKIIAHTSTQLSVVQPLAEAIERNSTLKYDNASPDVVGFVIGWLNEARIYVLLWPAKLPVPSSILQRRWQPHMNAVQNRRQLINVRSQPWKLLPQKDLETLIFSIPRRWRAVLNSSRTSNFCWLFDSLLFILWNLFLLKVFFLV